ncbi:MAG TPA: cysteine desulfurase-like protein [Gaiellaceae bacterium]|nr:cysteine desulfurase-like protein [Gaiellaceae bacterium]
MSTVTFDVAAVRARFAALQRPTAFFDGPGGTQTPDAVIDAVASYLREANANLGGPFETSLRSDQVVHAAHDAAARFLGASPSEVGFGQNMTTLNFALTRSVGRDLSAGDEIVVTRLDHDANVSPWLELAGDLDLVVRFADLHEVDCTLDYADLEAQISERTKVVAFPWASNAVGSITDVRRVADLAHEAGALAWVDAVHYAPHGPIDVAAAGVDVLICSPYKFFGPHLGLFFGRRDMLEGWDPYKVRPSANEPVSHRFETGTLPHELLAGCTAAVEYIESVGWDAIVGWERELGQRFLEGLPEAYTLYGTRSMEIRTPTFALTHPSRTPEELADELARRDIAAWPGNYYALEIMERLGLTDGCLRVGIVHYNTVEEVDRLLSALAELASC